MRLLTRDLYEGAYLMSQGMELSEIWVDGCNGKRAVVFEFVGNNADVLRKDYQRGSAQVNILKLKSSLNELKDRMFSVLRSPVIPKEFTGRSPITPQGFTGRGLDNRLRKEIEDEPVYRSGDRRS